MVLGTLVYSPFRQLMQLLAQKCFIECRFQGRFVCLGILSSSIPFPLLVYSTCASSVSILTRNGTHRLWKAEQSAPESGVRHI